MTTESKAALRHTKQAAAYLGLTYHTLEKWRRSGGGPRFVKFPNAVRYRVEDLDAFIEARLCANTSQAAS